jgi:hypothetical protein
MEFVASPTSNRTHKRMPGLHGTARELSRFRAESVVDAEFNAVLAAGAVVIQRPGYTVGPWRQPRADEPRWTCQIYNSRGTEFGVLTLVREDNQE